jgi:hypothetical protein
VTSPTVTERIDGVAVLPIVLPFVEEPAPVKQPRVLPFTGAWLLPLLALGSGAMLIGALLTGASRSRRPQE